MPPTPPLIIFSPGQDIKASEANSNNAVLKVQLDTYAVLTDVARTITAVHTFTPSATGAPFTLGGTALGQLVTGLNADQLDGQDGSYYQNATNLTAGTVPDARFPATLPAKDGSQLTNLNGSSIASGTVAAARIGGLPASATWNSAPVTLPGANAAGQLTNDGTGTLTWQSANGQPAALLLSAQTLS